MKIYTMQEPLSKITKRISGFVNDKIEYKVSTQIPHKISNQMHHVLIYQTNVNLNLR